MTADCVLKLVLLLAVSLLCRAGDRPGFWLIREKEKVGVWQFRRAGQVREVTGEYITLYPLDEVMCVKAEGKGCELQYLQDERGGTARLSLGSLRPGRWVSLKDLTPPKVVPPPEEYIDRYLKKTQVGGSRSSSGCGGDLALTAPVCGETIDISDFRIQWRASVGDRNKAVSVLVERTDGPAFLFRSTTSAAEGQYAEDKLLEFLKKQQDRNDVVDVTVRLMADNGRNAVRLVHIPPSVRTERYQSRVRGIEATDPFLKRVQLMSLAMEEGMWSRAAEEARQLLAMASGVTEVQEYALVGLCGSDFEEEKARLRGELPTERYERLCAPAGSTTLGLAPTTPPSVGTSRRGEGGKTRLGIALVIGNWDYPDVPLNSVKSDVMNMSETLSRLGFQVTVRENLKQPRQFQEALDDVLKRDNASPDDILLVYYSGHGVQLDGKAQLLSTGVSASARVAEDVRSNAQSAEDLLSQMERATPGTRIFIVDACRNNVLAAPSGLGGQSPRSGFAFQQDDVPNTFIMFADKPGRTTPVRSDYGLMGPFTESLIYALRNSKGDIEEVFELARKKTAEISPGQEPMPYRSKRLAHIVLRETEARPRADRAAELLNGAEVLYQNRAWDQFLVVVKRAQAVALDAALVERLGHEAGFVGLVMSAEKQEESHNWKEAAVSWQKASEIFLARQWVGMNAALAWLMADEIQEPVRVLAVLAAETDGKMTQQANLILGELLHAFPELEADARESAKRPRKLPGREFELIGAKE